jgi:hypothetical protein
LIFKYLIFASAEHTLRYHRTCRKLPDERRCPVALDMQPTHLAGVIWTLTWSVTTEWLIITLHAQ